MKKTLILMLAILLTVGVASLAMAAMDGTVHDLAASPGTQICLPCHVPHKAPYPTAGPLWNHMLSNATYNLYADPDGTMDATVGQPAGVSKLCLGCHDGTVGKSSYGSVTNATDYLTGTKSLGTDLRDDHPLSFTYNAALATADGGLVTPANGKVSGLPLYGALSDQLECASCHNAHDNTYTKFLRASNDSSALCLKCHTK